MRKKRNKLGIMFMFLGTLLLAGAVSLLFWNRLEDRKAQETSEKILYEVVEEVEIRAQERQETTKIEDYYNETMPEKIVNGHSYIGYLTLPTVNLQLPVMAECNYTNLRIAPCRHFGSTVTEDLVIAAHNYASHFGKLKQLNVGEEVLFTDMNGKIRQYEVAEVNVLNPTDVEEMMNGEFELSLYTCTYGGRSRLTIRCIEIK